MQINELKDEAERPTTQPDFSIIFYLGLGSLRQGTTPQEKNLRGTKMLANMYVYTYSV